MAYRNKTYVAFDGDEDIRYFNLMKAWNQNDKTKFEFYDAHDINQARDSSEEESIKKQLMIRMQNSKVFVILIGEQTKFLYKFVRWEIEQAIKRDMPIIAVNLNKSKKYDGENCPSILKKALAIHISFNPAIMQYALENWPSNHESYKSDDKIKPFQYADSVYEKLGVL
jgi:hypothetical protein